MNSAKKIMKNGGENATQSTVKQSRGLSKNMILILVGIILVAVLGGGVCYVNLRPRAILTVEGKDADGKTVTHTINYPEAMYDIYQAEAMASMYQMYGMSFDWSDTTEDGDTYAALYKKQIMQTLKKREILYMCAQKKGMTLTDEEKKTIKEDVKSARKNMTDSQKAMKGLDEATITTVKEKDKLGEKYKDSIVSTLKIDKDKLKKSVDKKSYRQYTLQYYTFAKTETGSDNKTKDKDAKTLEQGKKDMIALQKKAASAKDFTKDVITDKDNDKVDDNNKGISYSTKDLIELMELFNKKKVNLVSLKENIDTTTATGKLLFTLISAISQFERDCIADRTREGLSAARARGRKGGRPPISSELIDKAKRLYDTKEYTMSEIEELTGVKRATLYRHLKK